MWTNQRKLLSWQMIGFELRNVIGNPYVHIFGVGLPIVLAMLITRVAVSQIPIQTAESMAATTIYLGMGALIPMAVLLMGYAVSYAEEMAKGVHERMRLFGIPGRISFCNRAVAEMCFIGVSFILFFASGWIVSGLEQPTVTGLLCYVICIFLFSLICLALGHGIACICRNFGRTYCVSMMTYFAFMILGGMMGIRYEDMPKWVQGIAKLLPVTYINRDFYQIWTGESYHFMPMIQSYLFLGALSLIILCIPDVVRTLRRR